tara:strand:- start:236 stop:1099 length:864 start_codon:yes stop_codon:yes gene_type:complete
MSNDVSIFANPGAVSTASRREPSKLAKALASANSSRRIQTNTNGTFRRIVNGEQVGTAVRDPINVVVVHALEKVSRIWYQKEYDPDAKPTLPDCWSNLGDRPDAQAGNPQGATCVDCSKNVDGSGPKGKGRACRFQRRLAVLLEGDMSGDIYQINIPAKSLFGKGVGNTHPFESYHRYLTANKEAVDTVVTEISYNPNADSMELQFRAIRGLSDEEFDLVDAVQARPDTAMACILTVAARDGVTEQPQAQADKVAEPIRKSASAKAAGVSAEAKASLAAQIASFNSD